MSDTPGVELTTIEKTGGAIVARPLGKMMDRNVLDALERTIDQASESEPRAPLVILDLSRVAIIPSLALAILMRLAAKYAGRQQRLKLAAVQPQVRKVFALSRLDEKFQFADSVDAAIE